MVARIEPEKKESSIGFLAYNEYPFVDHEEEPCGALKIGCFRNGSF
jgi:hypothetical protein